MTEPLSDRLDYHLAWERVKEDVKKQNFLEYPYLMNIIELDIDTLIEFISSRITQGTFCPSPTKIVDCPKPGWHIRPGCVLEIKDSIVYSALLIDAINPIMQYIDWSGNKVRFSYILKKNQEGKQWFEFGIEPWTVFQKESTELIDSGYNFVLFSDISAFYENIDIERLITDLRVMGASGDNLALLSTCLNRWAGSRKRGIPQGFSPSAILSEVYLDSIDRSLGQIEGIVHKRYSDDMRIFCKTERCAAKALQALSNYYREKGLNVQSSKTRIMNGPEARRKINGVTEIIPALDKQLSNEVEEAFSMLGPYDSPKEIRELVDKTGITPTLESLRSAFVDYYLSGEHEFDKTLFHYLLNRLGAANDPLAIEYCEKSLYSHPEETDAILDYFSSFIDNQELVVRISKFLADDKSLFEYQQYSIIKWAFDRKIKSDYLISFARRVIKSKTSSIAWHYCVAYIGVFGDYSDYDVIERLYNAVNDNISKTVIVCSLNGMEKSRRNSLYGRIKNDDHLVSRAIEYAKIL